MGYSHWVVQVPRLRCILAYTYTYAYSDSCGFADCDFHTNSYSHVYSDRYGDVYAYGDVNPHSYGDVNTNASCADGVERYRSDRRQLYCELDQCERGD